jgi:ribosomal protein L18
MMPKLMKRTMMLMMKVLERRPIIRTHKKKKSRMLLQSSRTRVQVRFTKRGGDAMLRAEMSILKLTGATTKSSNRDSKRSKSSC